MASPQPQGRTLLGLGGAYVPYQPPAKSSQSHSPASAASPRTSTSSGPAAGAATPASQPAAQGQAAAAAETASADDPAKAAEPFDEVKWQTQLVAQIEAQRRQRVKDQQQGQGETSNAADGDDGEVKSPPNGNTNTAAAPIPPPSPSASSSAASASARSSRRVTRRGFVIENEEDEQTTARRDPPSRDLLEEHGHDPTTIPRVEIDRLDAPAAASETAIASSPARRRRGVLLPTLDDSSPSSPGSIPGRRRRRFVSSSTGTGAGSPSALSMSPSISVSSMGGAQSASSRADDTGSEQSHGFSSVVGDGGAAERGESSSGDNPSTAASDDPLETPAQTLGVPTTPASPSQGDITPAATRSREDLRAQVEASTPASNPAPRDEGLLTPAAETSTAMARVPSMDSARTGSSSGKVGGSIDDGEGGVGVGGESALGNEARTFLDDDDDVVVPGVRSYDFHETNTASAGPPGESVDSSFEAHAPLLRSANVAIPNGRSRRRRGSDPRHDEEDDGSAPSTTVGLADSNGLRARRRGVVIPESPTSISASAKSPTSPTSPSSPPPPPLPPRARRNTRTASSSTADSDKQKRKRAAAAAALAKAKQERQEQESALQEWEKRILQADWEELEVAHYLNEFGKHVHEVQAIGAGSGADAATTPTQTTATGFSQPMFPSRWDYTDYSGDGPPKFNAVGYYLAWFRAILSYISPTPMVDLQRESSAHAQAAAAAAAAAESSSSSDEFRWQAIKANSERLYLSAMPLYESLGARLRRTWRWESKLRTLVSLVAYAFLWWRGLLIASAVFAVIMLVLSLKTYPPQPSALRHIFARQHRREEEVKRKRERAAAAPAPAAAAAVGSDAEVGTLAEVVTTSLAAPLARSRYSLAAEATRKYGLQASLAAGALADGHERAKNFALWRSPRATWRLLLYLTLLLFASLALSPTIIVRLPGLALGIVFFFVAPIAEYRPHWLGMEWTNPLDWIFAGVPNDAQYSVEILRRRAARGQPLLDDPGLLLPPDDDVLFPSSASTDGGDTDTATDVDPDEAGAAEGERDPAAPTTQKRINWSKWSDRVLRGKSLAIRSTEVLGGARSVALPRLDTSRSSTSSSVGSVLLDGLSRGVNLGLETIEAKSRDRARATTGEPPKDAALGAAGAEPGAAVADVDQADVDGTYWCIYEAEQCCGHLVITPEKVLFRALFAKRPRGRRGVPAGAGNTSSAGHSRTSSTGTGAGAGAAAGEDQPLLDPLTGEPTVPPSELAAAAPNAAPNLKVKVLFEARTRAVRRIRKMDAGPGSSLAPWGSSSSKGSSNASATMSALAALTAPRDAVSSAMAVARNNRGLELEFEGVEEEDNDEGEEGRERGRGRTTVRFWRVVKRNEAFNRLVGVVPKEWEKVW